MAPQILFFYCLVDPLLEAWLVSTRWQLCVTFHLLKVHLLKCWSPWGKLEIDSSILCMTCFMFILLKSSPNMHYNSPFVLSVSFSHVNNKITLTSDLAQFEHFIGNMQHFGPPPVDLCRALASCDTATILSHISICHNKIMFLSNVQALIVVFWKLASSRWRMIRLSTFQCCQLP